MKKIFFSALMFFVAPALFAQCPRISTASEKAEYKDGDQVMITATVDNKGGITYNWSVSAGAISSGQGTSAITIDSKGLAGQTITATLEVGGIPRECSSTSSFSVLIVKAKKPGKLR